MFIIKKYFEVRKLEVQTFKLISIFFHLPYKFERGVIDVMKLNFMDHNILVNYVL